MSIADYFEKKSSYSTVDPYNQTATAVKQESSSRLKLIADAHRKRESLIKLSTDRKRKAEAEALRIKNLREKNGLVLNFDGTFSVVQQTNTFAAKQRTVPFAASANPTNRAAPLHRCPLYVPIAFLCRNRHTCTNPSHFHQNDRTHLRKYRDLRVYKEQRIHIYLREPDMADEVPHAAAAHVSPERYAQMPMYVRDLFNVVLCFGDEHARRFPECADEIFEINLSEMEFRRWLGHDVEALRERLGALATAREEVRAQYTKAKDIQMDIYRTNVRSHTDALVQARVVTAAAKATLPPLMEKLLRDFLATHDEERLLDDIVRFVRTEQANMVADDEEQ